MSETMRGRGWRAAAWRMVAFAAAVVAGAVAAGAAKADTLVPWADSTWKYKVVPWGSEPGFQETGFDDSAWPTARAPFGEIDCGLPIQTSWQPGTDLIARSQFHIDCVGEPVRVRVAIDNALQVWVNGIDVSNGRQVAGFCAVRDRFIFTVPPQALVSGTNLIAVRAYDEYGASYFDLAIDRGTFAPVSASPTYIPVYDAIYRQPPTPIRFNASLYPGFSCPEGLSYRWQRRDTTVTDGNAAGAWIDLQDEARYAGTATAELTILTPNDDLAVPHRCTIITPCLCSEGGIAVRASNTVSFGVVRNAVAWGDMSMSQDRIPGGFNFEQIAVSGATAVGLRSDGSLVEWGGAPEATTRAGPAGRYISVAAGWGAFIAIRDDGSAVGWGENYHCAVCPPAGAFRKVVPAFAGGIGIRDDGTLVSWGSSGIYTTNVPLGRFRDLAAFDGICYAIREDGSAIRFTAGLGSPPPVPIHPDTRFTSVSMGNRFAILHASDGTLRGDGGGPGASVPTGTFVSVAAGYGFGVALRDDGAVVQWGDVPAPAATPPPGGFRQVWAGPYSGTVWAFTTDSCPSLGSIVITTQPTTASVSPLSTAQFFVDATGPMPMSYRWRRNGFTLSDGQRVSGTTTQTLTIFGVRSQDQGFYDCIVNDACRRVVSDPGQLSCRPVFQREPSNAMIAGGQSVPIDVEVTGFPTSLQWRKDGVPLRDSASYSGVNTATLWITGNDPNQSGSYDLVAVNACGSTVSTKATIVVTDGSGPACPGDFNGDGGVDGLDLFLFFENWEQGC